MAVDPFEKLGIDPHEEAVDPFEKMGIDPNADNVPRGTSPAPEEKPAEPSYMMQRAKNALSAIQQNPMMPLAAPAMAPYYKSIGTGVGEAAQNIANFAIKNMRNDPMSRAGMGAAQSGSVINKMGEQPISIFDTNKAYDPQVAKLSRELAPMAIPFAGQEALATKIGSLIPYATSTGVKGVMEGAVKGLGRQALKAIPRGIYGGAFGATAEMAENKEATPESVTHAAKTGGAINAIIPNFLDAIPGAYKGLANHYTNVANEVARKGGEAVTPTQALALHGGLKDDVLSFPDLVKAPKLQSFYHGFLRYMPFTGIAKQEAEAVGRLENDAGKVHADVLGGINEADEVKARKSIVDDVVKDVNERFPLKKMVTEEIPEEEVVAREIPEFIETKGAEELDPLASRENIVKDINKHVESQEKIFAPKFQEVNEIPIKFTSSATMNYAKKALEEEEGARKSGISTTLSPGLITKLKVLAKGGKTEEEGYKSFHIGGDEVLLSKENQEKLNTLYSEVKDDGTSLGAFRKAVAKHWMKANELESAGKLSESMTYKEIASALDKDLESSVAGSAPNIYDKFKTLNAEYKKAVIPFKHPKVSGLNKITDETINYSSEGELENILSNTNNREAILQLPQETKNKIALRLINHNINPKTTNQTQRFFDAYSKLNSYERSLMGKSEKDALDSLHNKFNAAKEEVSAYNVKMGKSNEDIKIKNKEIRRQREEIQKQNEELYSPDVKKIMKGNVDINSDELEGMLKNYNNRKFIEQLPKKAKTKIFSRILNSNIGKPEQALNTRAERIAAGYNKMSSYERELLDQPSREKIENITKRVEQLSPILKRTKSAFWRFFYHGRHIVYAAGLGALHLINPYTAAAAIPLSAAGRMLRSPKLMETYKTGKYPETGKGKAISGLLSKAAITESTKPGEQ